MVNHFSLNNFGVPLEGGKHGPQLQPKRNHHFRVRFLNFGTIGEQAPTLTLQARTAALPTMTQSAQEVHAYNSIAYYAGKHQWNEVEVSFYDDVTNMVSRRIDAQIQRQFDHYNQTGYRAATDYKFTYMLDMMDGSNDAILETWLMEGSFITSYATGQGDYSDTGTPKMITLNIRYDNAIHLDENGNVLMAAPATDPRGRTL